MKKAPSNTGLFLGLFMTKEVCFENGLEKACLQTVLDLQFEKSFKPRDFARSIISSRASDLFKPKFEESFGNRDNLGLNDAANLPITIVRRYLYDALVLRMTARKGVY